MEELMQTELSQEANRLKELREQLVYIKRQIFYISSLTSDEKEAAKLKLMYMEKNIKKEIAKILREEREKRGGKQR